jgi:hypothetical protein
METQTRKLRLVHIVILAILLLTGAFLVAGWLRVAPSLAGKGDEGTTFAPSTIP